MHLLQIYTQIKNINQQAIKEYQAIFLIHFQPLCYSRQGVLFVLPRKGICFFFYPFDAFQILLFSIISFLFCVSSFFSYFLWNRIEILILNLNMNVFFSFSSSFFYLYLQIQIYLYHQYLLKFPLLLPLHLIHPVILFQLYLLQELIHLHLLNLFYLILEKKLKIFNIIAPPLPPTVLLICLLKQRLLPCLNMG